ncbi:MAG: hypothetical protein H6709_16270 [Kofleriaceae bacterium]|nr:hypothetical protein [Myxococcales bacterium]MCB9563181.1 hypothetical protein [Kofleriaceae bacterium]MCB9573636.1 hypothetical protein [Kofleriaceae bacterium]
MYGLGRASDDAATTATAAASDREVALDGQQLVARHRQVRQVADDVGQGRPIELEPDAIRAMQAYAWPGNLREMRNAIERALLFAGGATRLRAVDLHLGGNDDGATAEAMTLEEVERRHVEQVLRAEGGNVERAATRLGLSRSTLYQKLKRYRDEAV